jgi:hypothetical protein
MNVGAIEAERTRGLGRVFTWVAVCCVPILPFYITFFEQAIGRVGALGQGTSARVYLGLLGPVEFGFVILIGISCRKRPVSFFAKALITIVVLELILNIGSMLFVSGFPVI